MSLVETLQRMDLYVDTVDPRVRYELKQPADFAAHALMAPPPRSDDPLVSCLMVTRGDVEVLRFAVACFARQTWVNRELIVVTDHERAAAVEAFLAASGVTRSAVFGVEAAMTLGDRRNLSIARSGGEILVQWDDDDLCDPNRVQTLVAVLKTTGAAAAFLGRWLIWWPARRQAAISFKRLWEASGAFRRESARVYPAVARGEDTAAVRYVANEGPVAMIDAPFQYVYTITGFNTSPGSHLETLFGGSALMIQGDAYEELMALLEARVPIREYGALLERRR